MAESSLLLSREDAAAFVGVSLKTFQRHVAPALSRVPIGTRVLYDRRDLLEWLDSSKVGPSTATAARGATRSAFGTRVSAITDRRGTEIAERLRRSRRESSKK